MEQVGRRSSRDAVIKKVGEGAVQVRELVSTLLNEGYRADEVAASLIDLEKEKRVTVKEAEPYLSLGSYTSSPNSYWFWASLTAVGLSLGFLSVTSGGLIYLRYAFGGALILLLPGYALVQAIYPKRELDDLTRFALSVGLSLAIVPLTGLVLNYTPLGIRLGPVAVTIAGLTIFFLVLALTRKYQYYRLANGVVRG